MTDTLIEAVYEIEDNEPLDDLELQEIAEFFAQNMYEEEARHGHSTKISTGYKRICHQLILQKLRGGCLFLSSICEIMESAKSIVGGFNRTKPLVLKGWVYDSEGKDLKELIKTSFLEFYFVKSLVEI